MNKKEKKSPQLFNVPLPPEEPITTSAPRTTLPLPYEGPTTRSRSRNRPAVQIPVPQEQTISPSRFNVPLPAEEPGPPASFSITPNTTLQETLTSIQDTSNAMISLAESIQRTADAFSAGSARSEGSARSARSRPRSVRSELNTATLNPYNPAGSEYRSQTSDVENQLNYERMLRSGGGGGSPSIPSSWGSSSDNPQGGNPPGRGFPGRGPPSGGPPSDDDPAGSVRSSAFLGSERSDNPTDWAGFYESLENTLALELAYRRMIGDTDANRGNYRRKPITTPIEQWRDDIRRYESEKIRIQRIFDIKYENGEDTTDEMIYLSELDNAIADTMRFLKGMPQYVQPPLDQDPFPNIEVPVIAQIDEIQKKLTSQTVEFQKKFEKTFFDLNQFISDSVRNKVYIDTNVIFGQIRNATGDFFTDQFVDTFLMPIFARIQLYNEGRMIGYNPLSIQFPIISPLKPTVLYSAPPKNALPGTNNEIIFENIPDGGVYSQFMGKYGNIKHPEFPLVELKFNKNVVSGKFVCTQKVDGKEKSRKFDDVNQAKGWAIRGGFYADKIEKLRQSAIQDRYVRKLRVIPVLKK